MVCPPPCVSLPAFALELLDQQKANTVLIWMCADFMQPQDEATAKLLLMTEEEEKLCRHWELCDGFEAVLELFLDVSVNLECIYNRWCIYIYYNCAAYIEFFKQMPNITYRNNFKTNLFTKLLVW